jgi:hypothetical protein
MTLGFWQAHPGPNWWLRAGFFNLVIALVLGVFLALAFRFFVLIWAERAQSRGTRVLRGVLGVVFLALGALYALVAWPMFVWDHPARIMASGSAVAVPLVAAARRRKNPRGPYPPLVTVFGFLFVILLLMVAVATLLRAGLVTLKGHRVVQLVEVTGETRAEIVPGTAGDPSGAKQVTAHRVILLLTDGSTGADVWVYGSRVAFAGRALLVSKAFNRMNVPNLYEFLTIHNGGSAFKEGNPAPYFSVPFPDGGSLALNSWWRPVRDVLLNAWADLGKDSALLGLRIVENQSPYYPLADADGRPLKGNYLLDLTLDGVPTSRGSSPLERR